MAVGNSSHVSADPVVPRPPLLWSLHSQESQTANQSDEKTGMRASLYLVQTPQSGHYEVWQGILDSQGATRTDRALGWLDARE